MPKNLHKSIHVYLSKLKKPNPKLQTPPNLVNSSKNWILSGCKHTKTLSFAIEKPDTNNRQDDAAATLSDIDRFLFENFNSLYGNEIENDNDKKKKKKSGDQHDDGFLFESPRLVDPPPANIRASNRFFVSPGTSSSLVEEARSSAGSTFDDIGSSSSTHTRTSSDESLSVETEGTKGVILPEDSIAVLRNTPNPYEDFQRSMQDMIEARLEQNQSVDWDFMEELLFCYLRLNEKKSYKYVLGAFVDLVVSLRQNSGESQPKSRKNPSKGERRRRK